jgi:hypothetical protein
MNQREASHCIVQEVNLLLLDGRSIIYIAGLLGRTEVGRRIVGSIYSDSSYAR